MSDPSPYQPPPPPPPQFQAPPPTSSGLTDNAACGLAYVTFIPAIIFLIVEPYNRSPNVRFHSWQSIFLAIAWVVVDMVLIFIGHMPLIGLINVMLFPLAALGFFILWLIVIINAFNGKRIKLPIIGNVAQQQADR